MSSRPPTQRPHDAQAELVDIRRLILKMWVAPRVLVHADGLTLGREKVRGVPLIAGLGP